MSLALVCAVYFLAVIFSLHLGLLAFLFFGLGLFIFALAQENLATWKKTVDLAFEALVSDGLDDQSLTVLFEVSKQAKLEGLLSLQGSKLTGLSPALADAFRWVASGKDPLFAQERISQHFEAESNLDLKAYLTLKSLKSLVLSWGIFVVGVIAAISIQLKNEAAFEVILWILSCAFFLGDVVVSLICKRTKDWVDKKDQLGKNTQRGMELILTGGSFELFYQSYLAQKKAEKQAKK